MLTELDVVMVGMVLSQKDCGLALPTVVGMLMQLVMSVHERGAAEQCAASRALGDVSGATHVRICHACAGAVTFSICHEQGCVFAVEVVDLLLQLDNFVLTLVSCRLGVFDSVGGVDAGGQTHACVCGAGCKRRGVLSLKHCYVLLQLTVRLFVGMRLLSCLSELCVCGQVNGHASCRMCV